VAVLNIEKVSGHIRPSVCQVLPDSNVRIAGRLRLLPLLSCRLLAVIAAKVENRTTRRISRNARRPAREGDRAEDWINGGRYVRSAPM